MNLPSGFSSVPPSKVIKMLRDITPHDYWTKEGDRTAADILFKRSEDLGLNLKREDLQELCEIDDSYDKQVEEIAEGQKHIAVKRLWPSEHTIIYPVYDDGWCCII